VAIHRPEVSAFREWLLEEARQDNDAKLLEAGGAP